MIAIRPLLFLCHLCALLFISPQIHASGMSGNVTAAQTSQPLENIQVAAYQYHDYGSFGYWDFVSYGVTDVSGDYSIGGLDAGDYRIGFRDNSGWHVPEYYNDVLALDSAANITVGTSETVPGINASLATASLINGTVTDEVTGLPLENIYVQTYRWNLVSEQWDYVSTNYTDATGNYSIGGLIAGSYRIGFFDYYYENYLTEYYNDSSSLESATDISVAAVQTVSDINVALHEVSRINGTVTSELTGLPLKDIQVTAYRYYDGGSNGYWGSVSSSYSDVSGNYSIGGLDARDYCVRFSDNSGQYFTEYYNDAPDLYSANNISVGVSDTVTGMNAALATAGRINGTVTNELTSQPLGDIYVVAYRWNPVGEQWDYVSYDYTDASGDYSVGELTSGNYRIGFFDQDYGNYVTEYYDNSTDINSATDIAVGASQTVIEIDAALATASKITGTVTDEVTGLPLKDIYVHTYRWDSVNLEWDYVSGVYTDASGDYNVGGLSSGNYRIGFFDYGTDSYVTEYYDNSSSLDSATDIAVAESQTVTGIDATLREMSRINGTVTDELSGLPLENIRVTVYQSYDHGSYLSQISSSYSDASGNYSIGRLDAGDYRIRFQDTSGGHITEYYNNAPNLDSASDITVAGFQTVTGFDAALAPAARINGTVTDEVTNQPLEGIEVEIYRWNSLNDTWDSISYVHTDVGGFYSVGELTPGSYRMGFFDFNGYHATEYYNNSPDIDSALDIVVGAAPTVTEIDAALRDKSRISGTVTSEQTSQPLEDIQVIAYQYYDYGSYGYWISISTGYTDANGTYSIGGLDAGNFRIGFHDNSGAHLTEYYDNAPNLDSATGIAVEDSQTVPGIDAALTLESTATLNYSDWAAGYNLEGASLSPNISPMNDGISNLLKYAFNLRPDEVASGPDRQLIPGSGVSGLPSVSLESGFLKVEYVRRKGSPDLIYQVEFSTSLVDGGPGGWQPADEVLPPAVIDSEWERVTVYDDVPASSGGHRFGRVRVELQGVN